MSESLQQFVDHEVIEVHIATSMLKNKKSIYEI